MRIDVFPKYAFGLSPTLVFLLGVAYHKQDGDILEKVRQQLFLDCLVIIAKWCDDSVFGFSVTSEQLET